MEKVRLGQTGLKVSRICLGTMTYGRPKWRDWVLEEEPARPFIKRALEAGINFFDTADIYSNGAGGGRGPGAERLRRQTRRICAGHKVFNPDGWPPMARPVAQAHNARDR